MIGLSSLDVNIFGKREGSHAIMHGDPAGQVIGITGEIIDRVIMHGDPSSVFL
jgi:hypothetical protein